MIGKRWLEFTLLPPMPLVTWPFAVLRFVLILLIFDRFWPVPERTLYLAPQLYYGLPALLLLALLGVHRYWFLPLGALILSMFFSDMAPDILRFEAFPAFLLGCASILAAFTPCDRDVSLRAWVMAGKTYPDFPDDPRSLYNFLRFFLCALYARSFLAKTNIEFLSGTRLVRRFAIDYFGADFLYTTWFPALCALAAGVIWALTLVFTVGVWIPRIYRPLLVLAFAFHGVSAMRGDPSDSLHWLYIALLLPLVPVALREPRPAAKASKVLTTP